jgi:hypothetical protein
MYFQIVLRMIIMILLEELVVPRDFGQLNGLGNSMVSDMRQYWPEGIGVEKYMYIDPLA